MKKKSLFTLTCLFLWTGMAMAQVSRITGVVVSAEDNEPIVGASVLVKGTTLGTITDMNGRYSINNVPVNAKSLVISFVGMKTQELAIKGGEQRVVMQSDTELIDEVVVVAYGTQKKSSFTGAASTVGAKSIEKRAITNVTAALEGNASGVQVTAATGQPGESSSIRIRGFGSVNASNAPLYVVDGTIYNGSIGDINPADIESMTILKDAASTSLYGSSAGNGVILITTKKGKSGKPSINYNNNFRFNSPLNMPHMADSYSFALAINDQLTNGGQSPMYSEKKLQQILDYQHGKSTQYMWATDAGRWNAFDDPNRQDVMPTANTDWLHELFGDSFTQEHSISVNGGTDVMQYYMSANYLDEGGLLKYGDDGRQRYSFTGKINADLAKWLKVGYSVRFNRIDYSSPSFASAGENKEMYFILMYAVIGL